ncbi:hypothetical protein M422DRAFT_246252 [Sphaerobolus stellatus SS14]|nr:hypothetical protein M422DRAFT_246252 [Sphaerobolus stellatus SS14]
MQLQQSAPALNKGKKLLTGNSQSKSSAHTSQPAKIRQSSQQQLDADLEAYNKQCEPVLPYSDEPPISEPGVEMIAPTIVGTSGTLPDESGKRGGKTDEDHDHDHDSDLPDSPIAKVKWKEDPDLMWSLLAAIESSPAICQSLRFDTGSATAVNGNGKTVTF